MLFRAAEPSARYRVLEHFYRLPEPLIGRFYADALTRPDKLRILSGRPPVPIGKALAALREKQA
jgi:lycopene beta-cyclase